VTLEVRRYYTNQNILLKDYFEVISITLVCDFVYWSKNTTSAI